MNTSQGVINTIHKVEHRVNKVGLGKLVRYVKGSLYRVVFHTFTIIGLKNIVHHTEDFVI